MKIELLEPSGDLTPWVVSDALSQLTAEHHRTVEALTPLTALELQLVFDWATREMLAASDNRLRRRPRPYLMSVIDCTRGTAAECEVLRVKLAQATSELEETQAHLVDVQETEH